MTEKPWMSCCADNANPLNFWVNGNVTADFVYYPGENPKPFHVSLTEKGVHRVNLLVFGQDEAHVRKLMVQACAFAVACAEKYMAAEKTPSPQACSASVYRLRLWRKVAKAAEDGTLNVHEATRNKAYKISWANNDTV